MTKLLPSLTPVDVADQVRRLGLGVMRQVYSQSLIEQARKMVLSHQGLMKNTRPTPSSRHLAGFHRFPALEGLHVLITNQPRIRSLLEQLCGKDMRTIGVSDITINRSQQWHKDLLRGRFSHFLGEDCCCSTSNGTVFKVVLYLQDSATLQFVPGSHRQNIPLTSDRFAIPEQWVDIKTVKVQTGDVVIMDICTTHRGASEQAFQSREVIRHPRILISTVVGRARCPLTEQMEAGNAVRLADWARRRTGVAVS